MSLKETITQAILNSLLEKFNYDQLRDIESAVHLNLNDYEVQIKKDEETQLTASISSDARTYQMFFVAKRIEGLGDGTLKYYHIVLNGFFKIISKPISAIGVDEIRFYLASRQSISKVSLNNERRILSSFFSWLHNEEHITRNPMLKIKNIKQPKILKKPFSAREIEELRACCKTLRDEAIFELLLSTGMRCAELCNCNRSDLNLADSEIIVLGKGNKQRTCYLNAPASKKLTDYLKTRTDNLPPLFLAYKGKNHKHGKMRLKTNGVEVMIRLLGFRAGIQNTHPHRFRRTAATTALQRGMPVDQVRIFLGHEQINTTMQYAITADEAVKHAHSRYM